MVGLFYCYSLTRLNEEDIKLNKKTMTTKLKLFIFRNYSTATSYADSKGVSPQFISAVLRGVKEPSDSILEDLGLKKMIVKEVTYVQRT